MPRLLLLVLLAAIALPASAQSSDRLRNTDTTVKPADGTAQLGAIVGDGSFEAGTPNPVWTEASSTFGTPLCDPASCGLGGGTGPRTGSWWTWFGGSPSGDVGSVEQSVTIPAGSAQLKFWLEIPLIAAGGTGFVAVRMGATEVFRATYAADQTTYATYQEVTVNATPFAGTTTTLRFESTTTGSGNFFIDDVSIEATPAGPSLNVSPTNINFGGVQVGATSAAQNVTLTNNGTGTVTITSITGSGAPFTVNTTGTDLTLDTGETTTFAVTFAPAVAGPAVGTVLITSNAPGSPATVTLSGTGTNFVTFPSTDTPVTIPDNAPGGVTSTIVIPGSETRSIADLDVDLNATHSWIGDLAISLTRGATSVVIMDRPGYTGTGFGCSGDNPNIIADDEGTAGSIETGCVAAANPGYPVPDGRYTPDQPLSAFDGSAMAGTYVLTVSDNAAGDTGSLDSWALLITPQGGVATESGPNGVSSLRVSPNPVTTQGQVSLSVATSQSVRVALYDALGREVRVLLDRSLVAGQEAHIGFRTNDLPAGVYVIRATGTDVSLTERITVVR